MNFVKFRSSSQNSIFFASVKGLYLDSGCSVRHDENFRMLASKFRIFLLRFHLIFRTHSLCKSRYLLPWRNWVMPSCYAHARNNELWIHQWSAEEEKEVMPTMKKLDIILISLITSEKHTTSENLWKKGIIMPLDKRKKKQKKIGIEILLCDRDKRSLRKKR